jgi:hypothetical protein
MVCNINNILQFRNVLKLFPAFRMSKTYTDKKTGRQADKQTDG